MSIQKKIKRILTLLLCGALLLCIMPNAAIADELSVANDSTELSTVSEGSEVVGLREENIKHFDMGDGTYQAVVYGHPVHELDESGNWQDIDFSLSLTGTRGNQKYTNQTAGVAFADRYEAGKPVMSLSKDGNAINMTLLSASTNNESQRIASAPIAAEVKNPEGKIKTIEEANQATFSSSVLYEDVVPGVDLEYIVDPGLVKENIIVKEPSDTYRYVFSLNLIGMYPVLQDNGSIYLFDSMTNEKTYIIPAPYMYDAAGYESEAVEYTILGSGNTYSLTVTADTEWINAADRSFPVTIDPSVVSDGAFATGDTYTNSEDPDANFGSRWVLWVRSTRTSYIKLPTPSIPDDAELNWASLTGFYYYYAGVTYGQTNISAHRIVGNWSQNTLTWNIADSMTGNSGLATRTLSSGTCYANKGAVASDPEIITFDITEVVQQWLDGTYPNYGVGLKFKTNSTNQSVVIKSTNAESQYRPRIVYQYSIEWPSASQPTIKPRTEWNARPLDESRVVERTRSPERIVFHHSAEKFSSIEEDVIKSEIKRIQDLHMDDKGKCDIAYHFVIDPQGNIWEGAEIDDYQRGHTQGYFDDIGVLILGDFEPRLANGWNPDILNDNQKEAMKCLAKWLCYEYNLPPSGTNCPITTHRLQDSGTVCPGENAAPWIESDLADYIQDWYYGDD